MSEKVRVTVGVGLGLEVGKGQGSGAGPTWKTRWSASTGSDRLPSLFGPTPSFVMIEFMPWVRVRRRVRGRGRGRVGGLGGWGG